MSAERDWRDDPAFAHLRDDAQCVVCSECSRRSWGALPGSRCGLPQPDGSTCEGVFLIVAAP